MLIADADLGFPVKNDSSPKLSPTFKMFRVLKLESPSD